MRGDESSRFQVYSICDITISSTSWLQYYFFHQSFGDDRRPLPELREIQSRYVFENVPKLDKF